MPTNYPTSLDNFTNPTANDSLNLPSHSTQHANANDAIEAIEAKLGLGANVMPYAFSAGTASVGGGTSATVTFPVGRFTQTPIMQVSPNQSGLAYMTIAAFGGVSSSGVTVYMQKAYSDAVSGGSVHWFAIQMTAGTAAG